MIDPLTIVSTSLGLVTKCGDIYKFIKKVQNVDVELGVLGIEVDSLSQVFRNISSSFSDPLIANAILKSQTGHEGDHWQSVKRSMDDCNGTLQRLEEILDKIKDGREGNIGRSVKTVKLGMETQKVALLRQQIAAYRRTMELSLQMITV